MERRAEAEQEILDLINRSKWQEVASKCEEWEYLVRFFLQLLLKALTN